MRVRILHIIGSLQTGGAESALTRICQATRATGLDHQVLVLGRTGPLERDLLNAGVPVLAPRVRPLDWVGVMDLPGWRPQVLQGWMYHGSLAALALRSVWFPSASLVWNIRCGLDTPSLYRHSTRSLIRLLALLSSVPDRILYNAVSARMGHEEVGYARCWGEVIPNGFDLEAFRPDPASHASLRVELGLPAEVPIVGFIARFHAEKNPGLFLGALARLPREVHGLLAGPGMVPGNRALLGQVELLGLQDRVHLVGERRDMPRVMSALDLAVSASWNEGFSNALGEAQACGVPCVATDVGDSALIIGSLGRLVPPGDEEAMAASLSELLGLPPEARLALGRRCRQRMEALYSLPSVGQRYSGLYHRLAARL